ncbi:MAG: hypothetical protein C4532_07020 [Candidatus Abyssobacteria bacterium SURF_17]|jgi:Zn-finger nucleic acid-binding protein|uniref:Uncharacterized protein n=1 Tax=Candidatus Abyssobacteria bacterium SURF_17 TaxID=2093361 RepID=A0A419F148_9BACT|nr:MAG: hypothetical protein C4532_07020 [Candidatus Abyssubacteria bacterium SURF_17]
MSPIVIQCCVCLRVRKGDAWLVVDKPYQVMRDASHTYCPRCMKVWFDLPEKLSRRVSHRR